MQRSPLGCFALLFVFSVSCGGGNDAGDDEQQKAASPGTPDSTCASGLRWTGGDEESKFMHPGGTCIACHQTKGEGPSFVIAGTVYPAEHEQLDCFGASGADVVIDDADGQSITLTTNEAGNFMHSGSVVFPVHAKVVSAGKTREMQMAAPDGDCNHCHTDSGAQGAPGRILLP